MTMDAPEVVREEGRTASNVERIDVEAVNTRGRQKLYQARIKIYPKRAEGFYRRLKWIVMAVTLAIYWITPWIRWDRGPYAPTRRCWSTSPTGASTSSSSRSGPRNSTTSPAS
jgi:hypothetical protein